ncbi:hypothetical protein [Sulfurimonas sp.]|uniref:hypothetical protein n=1 Tax=Sulfurimonas sp. TaxID=2022749 RepID=UPI0025E2D48B|nr:hypothetical protein [Sulfurimonas sp.]MBW6488963.1 hypothetical protein [Sulfurimonas sp.]
MRPLLKNDLESFLKRFGNFIDAEFRSIEILTPTTLKITLAAQDSARGFDWITIGFEFSGVSDARLIESSKLPHADLSEGITLIHKEDSFRFALGAYNSFSAAANSACQIKASSLKYAEGSF